MTLPTDLWEKVRQRAEFACEYCGVTETATAGQLTVDHFQPQSRGGTDDLANLLYCCHRCNSYKADYWPTKPGDAVLWNPRLESARAHLLLLADGTLYPITAVGSFTITRLRLNRPPLMAHRLQKQFQAEEIRLLERYRDMATLLEQMHGQLATLLSEHRALLEVQRGLLSALLKSRE